MTRHSAEPNALSRITLTIFKHYYAFTNNATVWLLKKHQSINIDNNTAGELILVNKLSIHGPFKSILKGFSVGVLQGTEPGPLMCCRCCPGLDLLSIRCRGQNGTGAAPPSFLGSRALHCAGCDRCQLSSFAHFPHYQGLVWWGLKKLSLDSCNHTTVVLMILNYCACPFFFSPSPTPSLL